MSAPSNEQHEERLLDLATQSFMSYEAPGNKDPELPALRESWDQLSQLLRANAAAHPISDLKLVSDVRLRLSKRTVRRWSVRVGIGFGVTAVAASIVAALMMWTPDSKRQIPLDLHETKVAEQESLSPNPTIRKRSQQSWNEEVDYELVNARVLCREVRSEMIATPMRSTNVNYKLDALSNELKFSDL